MGSTTARVGLGATPFGRAWAWCVGRRHALTLWAAMVVWTGAMFAVVRDDYLGYRLARQDLGNMVQAVWSTAHGRLLESTTGTGEQISRLGSHVDPILMLLTPLWIALPSPLTLAAAQVAAVALGALPVFWLARRHVGSERVALLLAGAYLLYPWLAWSALDAIHPVTFAIPLLLFGVWFLDSDRLGAFAVCAVLAFMTGELMGLTVAGLGLWYALSRGRRRPGLAIAGAGVAWTLVALYVVVPAISGGSSTFFGFYERVGSSPQGILRKAVTDPGAILAEVFSGDVLLYVFLLSAPLAGLFLLAPAVAAVGLPQLALNALADPLGPVDPRQHYLAAIVPFLVAGTVFGVARLPRPHRATAALAAVVLSAVFTVALGPWSWALVREPLWYQDDVPRAHVAALDRAVARVPDGAAVSSSNKVGLRLSARRYVYVLPVLAKAEWIVLDALDPWLVDEQLPALRERTPGELEALRARIADDPGWLEVFAEDGVYVFRRR